MKMLILSILTRNNQAEMQNCLISKYQRIHKVIFEPKEIQINEWGGQNLLEDFMSKMKNKLSV